MKRMCGEGKLIISRSDRTAYRVSCISIARNLRTGKPPSPSEALHLKQHLKQHLVHALLMLSYMQRVQS